jgi:hypothetical protein
MVKEMIRTMEIPSVELTVVFNKGYYEGLMKEKAQTEKNTGVKMTIGEFIMQYTNNLLTITSGLNHIIGEQKQTIDILKATAGIKEVENEELPDGIKNPDEHMFG